MWKCKIFSNLKTFPVQRIAAGGGLLGGQRKSRVAATWLDQSNAGAGVVVVVVVVVVVADVVGVGGVGGVGGCGDGGI